MHCSWWTVGSIPVLSSIYTAVNNFNREVESVMSGATNFAKKVVDTATGWFVERTYKTDPVTGNVVVVEEVKPTSGGSSSGPVPTPTSTPMATPVPDSLVSFRFSENGHVNWFGNEASFPAGAYKIDASGWYTHWSPKPTVTKCVDQGLDPCAPGGDNIAICMPAWSSRGQNYPTVPVSDASRASIS